MSSIQSGLLLVVVSVTTVDAHAYLDPGTGSLILQGIIGTVAAAAAVGGVYWARIKAFFRRTERPQPRTDVDDTDGPD